MKTHKVLDSVQYKAFFVPCDSHGLKTDRAFDFFDDIEKLDTLNRDLLYDVCFSDVDGFMLKHPCSLDSALLVSLVRKLNYEDTQKGIKVRLQYVYYNRYKNSFSGNILKDGLLIFKGNPFYSPIYLNDDGTYQAACISSDRKKCDDLFARVVVSKKLFPDNVSAEMNVPWLEEKFSVYVDESNFVERFETNYLFSSIYYKRIHPYEGESVIPFEMCYNDGLAIPCDLTAEDRSRIQSSIEKEGGTLIALTHQSDRVKTINSFAIGGMSGIHTCKSSDGKHCDELFALVRRNKSHEEGFPGWLGLYLFNMKDFSFTLKELGYVDKIPIGTVGLFKKDGTLLANTP